SHAPPRTTRWVHSGTDGPQGSMTVFEANCEKYVGCHQSCVHSTTLPSVSYSPNGLACNLPTSCVLESALDWYQAASPSDDSDSPFQYLVCVPARQANSDSAFVGNRYAVAGWIGVD